MRRGVDCSRVGHERSLLSCERRNPKKVAERVAQERLSAISASLNANAASQQAVYVLDMGKTTSSRSSALLIGPTNLLDDGVYVHATSRIAMVPR